jgi:ferric-dicitrate binding protein FerR (iron transport regulator)
VWADGTRVDLGAASRVELPRHGDPFSVRLGHGRVDASIAPRPEGRPFALATAEATMTVEGTAFTVTSGVNGTDVALRHGALRVSAPTGEARLLPGDAAAVMHGQPPRLSTARDAPVRFRESHQEPGWTWRTAAVAAEARWFEVDGGWIRVLAVSASTAPGTALLPVPVLPTRWRAIVQLRVRSDGRAGRVALAVGDARLPLALEPGAWRRIHVVGDQGGVTLAGSPTRVALGRPADAIGVALTGVEVDIGEVVVLDEGP